MVSLVVMGVAGCGKSSLGSAVAQALGWPLIEGDDFHPPANVAKMRAGIPLVDADRNGWLALLGQELVRHPGGAVLTCSALKKAYRDQLRAALPGLHFVHLELSREQARTRVAQRAGGHYFQAGLVDSQFEALEPPQNEAGVLVVDATLTLAALTQHVVRWTQETPNASI
nr:gluconokinase [uncultured Albidiferax sp.]